MVVVIVTADGLMVRANGLLPVAPVVSVTVTVKFARPEAVGVPPTTPDWVSDIPGGSEPAVMTNDW